MASDFSAGCIKNKYYERFTKKKYLSTFISVSNYKKNLLKIRNWEVLCIMSGTTNLRVKYSCSPMTWMHIFNARIRYIYTDSFYSSLWFIYIYIYIISYFENYKISLTIRNYLNMYLFFRHLESTNCSIYIIVSVYLYIFMHYLPLNNWTLSTLYLLLNTYKNAGRIILKL